MITLDQLTPTQRVWVLRLPLIFVLVMVLVVPVIWMVIHGLSSSDETLELAMGIIGLYATFGMLMLFTKGIEWYEESNKLSTKMKAILKQQADDADEWGRIFDAYRRSNATPRYTHTNDERQRARDEEWKRRWDAL